MYLVGITTIESVTNCCGTSFVKDGSMQEELRWDTGFGGEMQ